MKHVVIIGNGVSGITAARFIRKKSDYKITVISAESDHFYSRTALMYIYMGHMTYEHTKPYEDWFWQKNRINLIRGYVDNVDTENKFVSIGSVGKVNYDVLIIASGSKPNRFGWEGEYLAGVQGLYSLQDLSEMESRTSDIDRAVIVGGGLIGIEMAEMLHTRHIPTTFLVRENSYMDYLLPAEESSLINDEIRVHDVDLRLGVELDSIVGDNGEVSAVKTSQAETVACQFVGLTAGVSPSISFLADSGLETNRGVLVDEYFETSATGVYAIGDCAEFREDGIGHRQIEQLWYSGRRHGKALAEIVCGNRQPYDRGVFFNSAKFFTIEYQTYGDISATNDKRDSHVWINRKSKRLIRVDSDKSTGRVLGFNLLGVRFRHDVCEGWIRRGTKVDDVLSQIRKADFDPEFHRLPDQVSETMQA